MELDFEALAPRERYKILTATVIPRPIALVTTRSASGVDNAAPFSFFNVFGEDPPIVVLGLQAHGPDHLKDTTAHIRRSDEFVVHLVDRPLAAAMSVCATDFGPEVSEFDEAGLTRAPCRKVDVARIAEAPVAFECRRAMSFALNHTRELVVGEIVHLHARDGLIDPETLHLDLARYDVVGRLFGDRYATLGEQFRHARMTPEEWATRRRS